MKNGKLILKINGKQWKASERRGKQQALMKIVKPLFLLGRANFMLHQHYDGVLIKPTIYVYICVKQLWFDTYYYHNHEPNFHFPSNKTSFLKFSTYPSSEPIFI